MELYSDKATREGMNKSIGWLLRKLEGRGDVETQWILKSRFIEDLKKSEEEDHKVVGENQGIPPPPTEFLITILGKRMKYSGCIWPEGITTIEQAEDVSLKQICERSQVKDGQTIMDLGCGFGSLSFYILEKFPSCQVTALSNSRFQCDFVAREGEARGYTDRLNVITTDANDLQTEERFDRIIAIEMIEDAVVLTQHWRLSGKQYSRTMDAWLERMDQNKDKVLSILNEAYGEQNGRTQYSNWKHFLMFISELFGFQDGNQWLFCQYLLQKRI